MSGRAIEYREQALAKLVEARNFAEDHPGARNAVDQKKFDALMGEFNALNLKFEQAAGLAPADSDASATLDDAWEAYAGKSGAHPLSGMPPLPSGQGGRGERSWGIAAGVVSTIANRGMGFAAELATSGNVPVAVPIRRDPVVDPRRARFIADVIPQDEAPGGRFSFWRQTVRTNLAAAVARGARKPTSIYTGEKVSDEVTTIAHLSEPVNRFDLEDAEMLRSFLTAELEYGLRLALDEEIVSGNNTPPHFNGILAQAALQADEGTMIGTCRAAITALQEIDVTPTHFAFAPATWERIEAEAAVSFPALPAFSPLDATAQRLHGIGVVVSNAVPANAGIVGDFTGGAILERTGPIRVDWSEAMYRADLGDGDPGIDWVRNMLAFRAELRAKLAVLIPAAFLELEFGS